MKGNYFTLSNGERLYYEEIGAGPETVVMMHGWTSSHEIYEKPAELLADPGSLFSPELADWYRENTNAPYQAVRFPDSNHMYISENPERFAEEVGRLL